MGLGEVTPGVGAGGERSGPQGRTVYGGGGEPGESGVLEVSCC